MCSVLDFFIHKTRKALSRQANQTSDSDVIRRSHLNHRNASVSFDEDSLGVKHREVVAFLD